MGGQGPDWRRLVRYLPDYAVLTPLGIGYETGLREAILNIERH